MNQTDPEYWKRLEDESRRDRLGLTKERAKKKQDAMTALLASQPPVKRQYVQGVSE